MEKADDKLPFATLAEEERRRSMTLFVKMGTSWVNLPLFSIFWIADIIYAPHLKWQFLSMRLSMIPVELITGQLVRRYGTSLLRVQLAASLIPFANSIIITAMMFKTDGLISPYYAGLNLLCAGILSLLPWTTRFLILNVVLLYAPYFLCGAIFTPSLLLHPTFLVSCFFIGGTIASTLGMRLINEGLRLSELTARENLKQEIISREKIIQEKTAEGLRLKALTNQFSPQVVHAIQAGKVDITSIHKADICAIFIDIVNSTDKVNQIEMEKIQKVISMFMEDTMKVLLKHDLTIDKFLGDGVLAFSNDPIQRPDYVERVMDAALEIKGRIRSRIVDYEASWSSELQIKIGIAEGPAHAGFYGNDEYFKSYTAIGKVVNLASRLCSAAEPNQILTDQHVNTKLQKSSYTFKEIGKKQLKGFALDSIHVYEVVDGLRSKNMETQINSCPKGHGILVLETNDEGIFVFVCRTCGYVLNEEDATNGSARAA